MDYTQISMHAMTILSLISGNNGNDNGSQI